MTIYLYLLNPPVLYAPYESYADASQGVRINTREKNESYVKHHWPHAFIYEHGLEWTVLPLDWRDRERLKVEAPHILIPNQLCMTQYFKGGYEELRLLREDRMWKVAAATWTEQMRTAELKGIGLELDAALASISKEREP